MSLDLPNGKVFKDAGAWDIGAPEENGALHVYDQFEDGREEAFYAAFGVAKEVLKGRRRVDELKMFAEANLAHVRACCAELENLVRDVSLVASGEKSVQSLVQKLDDLVESGVRLGHDYRSW